MSGGGDSPSIEIDFKITIAAICVFQNVSLESSMPFQFAQLKLKYVIGCDLRLEGL